MTTYTSLMSGMGARKFSPHDRLKMLEADVRELQRKRRKRRVRRLLAPLLFLLALPAFAATPIPPRYTPKLAPVVNPYPVTSQELPPTRATLRATWRPPVDTNYLHCVTNCPTNSIGERWVWDWPEGDRASQYFLIYGRAALNLPWALLGTNRVPSWDLYHSNGPIRFVTPVTVDRDMVKASDGKPK